MSKLFVVVVYDVDKKRDYKILTFLRTHLNWIQNSVFEGELTEAEYREVKNRLSEISKEEDSIVIYRLGSSKYVEKDEVGVKKGSTSRIL